MCIRDSGETVRHAYFPHSCVVSLLAVLEDGTSAEVALFGCEGVLGYASSLFSREAFGRYVVQVPGPASRVPITRLSEAAEASTTAGVDEFWFCGSSVIVWRAAGVVVASPTKRGCDRDRAALPRRDAR